MVKLKSLFNVLLPAILFVYLKFSIFNAGFNAGFNALMIKLNLIAEHEQVNFCVNLGLNQS